MGGCGAVVRPRQRRQFCGVDHSGVALNAYLTMLLDTGTLHCDPHPGNLLRTTDGKLCILDFGMCLEVPPDLQLSLLEFIANLQVSPRLSISLRPSLSLSLTRPRPCPCHRHRSWP